MNEQDITLNPNPLVQYLEKPASDFTKADIIDFVDQYGIEMINFRYVAEDGRLKSLNFVINNMAHLDNILSTGERVDGSSLFSYIGAGSSDLYVVPRFKTAYVNPFEEIPTLDILCAYYTFDGKPLEAAPEYLVSKAHELFRNETGFSFKALGELEYYIIDKRENNEMFPAQDQRAYHEAKPFVKFGHIRKKAMQLIAQCGGNIKYGHSEVGGFYDEMNYYEQQEIEFLPVNAEDAADQLIIAKWILRCLCAEENLEVSFAPKITVGKAGSGLHIHMMLEKDGKNMMVEGNGLSTDAKKLIAGILDLSDALTAFGNTIPTSYLRLVPHQEAPTNICWGDRNRSALVRVPLGWIGANDITKHANPNDNSATYIGESKQTVELRSGDGSADIHRYIAAIIIAALHGFRIENAIEIAEKLYIGVNIFKDENKARLLELEALPDSCSKSADALSQKREFFECCGIFPKGMIDNVISKLKAFDDHNLSERLYGKNEEIAILVAKHLHCK
jgi:glutamine synthetase